MKNYSEKFGVLECLLAENPVEECDKPLVDIRTQTQAP